PSPPEANPRAVRVLKDQGSAWLEGLGPVLEQASGAIPPAIVAHRLLEPLVWLKALGITLAAPDPGPVTRVRDLITGDLSRNWRAPDVARALAVSEATLRRMLNRDGTGFSRIVKTARLEHALGLLQTTSMPVTDIAVSCGFSTPSHFSESFRERFGIQPSQIRTRSEMSEIR
ncbi:MAG: AraC family transcriptional regulator, partial [Myxococcota bacterium]